MNWVDVLVLVVWGLTAIWGYRTGFIGMLVPLVVIIAGLALSSRVAEPIANIFSFISENENVQLIIAFIAIFFAVLLLSAWLSSLLRSVVRFIPIVGLADRLAGIGVGLLIGFILLTGVLTGLRSFPVGEVRQDINDSRLGRFLTDNFAVTVRAVGLVPGDWNEKARGLKEGVQEKADQLQDKVEGLKRDEEKDSPTPFPPEKQ
jgi:uncharacterized membrane protein required for colicin V production